MMRRTFIALVVGGLLGACTPRTPTKPVVDAYLSLAIEPPETTVRLDDRVLGSARVLAGRWVAVPHGVHRLSLTAPGFDRYDEEIDLAPGRHARRLDLVAAPER
jgi:hypothetical protein